MARRRHHRPQRDRSIEAELKFRLAGPGDHARLRAALRQLGGKLEGRYDEENYRFEGRGKITRRNTLRLRVLDGGPRGVLTAKGPAQFLEGVKVREETEVVVEDGRPLEEVPNIARSLGLDPAKAVKDSYSVLARKHAAKAKKAAKSAAAAAAKSA